MNDKTIVDNCTNQNDCGAAILVQQGEAKRITDMQQKASLSGSEFIVVAVGNQNFKVAVSDIVSSGGTSGFSGWSGLSGFSAVGVSGYSGFSGMTVVGTSGFSGFSGAGQSGFSGASAFSGMSGIGTSGFSGASGLGFSGFSGTSGMGTQGFSGFSGTSGRLTVTGIGFVTRINDPLNTYATRTFTVDPPLEIDDPQGETGNPRIYYNEACGVNSYLSIDAETTLGANSSYATGHKYTLNEVFQTQSVLENRGSSDVNIQPYSDDAYYEICANLTIILPSSASGAEIVLSFGNDSSPILETVYTVPSMSPDTFEHTISVSGLVKMQSDELYSLRMYMPVGTIAVSNVTAPRSYLTVKAIVK